MRCPKNPTNLVTDGISGVETMLARIHFYLALLFLTLLFCVDPAAGQSAVPDSGPTIGPAKPGLFDRVIANQKKDDEALDV